MPMNPRLLRPLATGGFDADAQSYITAVQAADGQALEQGVKVAYNDFITGCKADGIWDAIKASCILAGARTLAGALVPLKGAAPTNNNFTASDYNRETGLVGDGSTTYLDTNRAGDDDPQDDHHLAIYSSDTMSGTLINSGDLSSGASAIATYLGNTDMRSRNASAITVTGVFSGFAGISRSSASEFVYRLDGSSATGARTSAAPPAADYTVYAFNNGTGDSSSRVAFYSLGEALDLEALDTRVSALITAIGAAI